MKFQTESAPILPEAQMWLWTDSIRHPVHRPAFYTRHSGEGLFTALLYWGHERGVRISEMSFDTLSPDTLQQSLVDVGIESTFNVKHYTGSICSEELVQSQITLGARP